jgi:hypothetical protein
MNPGSSTSQVEVAVRWAIEASPAAAAAMATPSSTRIATLPISRPVTRAAVKRPATGQEPQPGLDRGVAEGVLHYSDR